MIHKFPLIELLRANWRGGTNILVLIFHKSMNINFYLSADAANNFNAEGLANPERNLNYLLRQQSEMNI